MIAPVIFIVVLVEIIVAKTVIVIGAGPVALSLVAKYLNQKSSQVGTTYKFKVVEKRNEYTVSPYYNQQRQQMLSIMGENLEQLPEEIRKELMLKGCFRNSKTPAVCYKPKDESTIPADVSFAFIMKDFEEIARDYVLRHAHDAQIEFIKGEFSHIEHSQAILNLGHKQKMQIKFDVLIGADGSNSKARSVIGGTYEPLPVPENFGGAVTYKV